MCLGGLCTPRVQHVHPSGFKVVILLELGERSLEPVVVKIPSNHFKAAKVFR